MLSQYNLWTEYAGIVLDVILMVRILTLRLRRTYVYLTLYVVLNLFYDVLALRKGFESPEFRTISEFSRFIYAIVFPLIAWDLYEEAKELVDKVRKLAMSRMLGSLIFISIWALVMAYIADDGSHYLELLSEVIWIGSVASALSFSWVMRRATRLHKWELPRNTTVWYWFVQLILATEAISFLAGWALLALRDNASKNMIDLVGRGTDAALQTLVIVVSGWCVYKLRAVSSDAKDEPVKVKS